VFGILGMIYAILDRMVFSGDRPLTGLLLSAFITFAVLTLIYVIFREDLKDKKRSAQAPAPGELQMPGMTGRLLNEREFEPIPAVTEDTTNLLPQSKTRKF
jgi:hypothetical protein